MLLTPVPRPNEKFWSPTPVLQLLPLIGYYLFVIVAPHVAGTSLFVGVVIIIRMLLFVPLILPSVIFEGGGKSYLTPRKVQWTNATPYQFILTCSALLWALQSLMVVREVGFNLSQVARAINDSPAVSALGYDFILSIISFGVWRFGFGYDLD